MTLPPVAPFEACIGCLRGDTKTGFGIYGEPEAAMAALHVFVGLSPEEAEATVLCFEEENGADEGTVRDGEFDYTFRLCRDCAAKGTPVGVGDIPDVPVLRPPEG